MCSIPIKTVPLGGNEALDHRSTPGLTFGCEFSCRDNGPNSSIVLLKNFHLHIVFNEDSEIH